MPPSDLVQNQNDPAASAYTNPQAVTDELYRQSPLEVRKLSPHMGAEIIGLDKIKGTPEWLRRSLNHLWLEYGVLVFRGVNFSEAEQVAFSKMFGEQEIHGRIEMNSKEHPELLYLSNRKDLGLPEAALHTNELSWHSDQTYLPRPALGSLLYAVEIPPEGGDTYWADLRTAFERLSQETKSKLEKLRAIHDYDNVNKSYGGTANAFQKSRTALCETHPLVRTHPVSLRKALYLAPKMTSMIEGLSAEESKSILDEMEAAATMPDLIYRHKWQEGDAVLWDNARVMHKRDAYSSEMIRFMRRTTIRPPVEVSLPF